MPRKSPIAILFWDLRIVTPDEIENPGELDLIHHGEWRGAPGVQHSPHDSGRSRADRAGIVFLHHIPRRMFSHRDAGGVDTIALATGSLPPSKKSEAWRCK